MGCSQCLYITDSWYKCIVDFVHKLNKRHLPKNKRNGEEISRTKRLEISEDIAPIPKQRNNDSFIMAVFLTAKIPKIDLHILNIMRMHVKAATVSDIATSDGKFISYNAWNLIGSNNLREDLDWPRQLPEFTRSQIIL